MQQFSSGLLWMLPRAFVLSPKQWPDYRVQILGVRAVGRCVPLAREAFVQTQNVVDGERFVERVSFCGRSVSRFGTVCVPRG